MTAPTPQQMRVIADGRRTWLFHGDWDEEAEAHLRAAADEVDRLRALIAHQQHDDLCAVWELNGGTSEDGCTCWKADVL